MIAFMAAAALAQEAPPAVAVVRPEVTAPAAVPLRLSVVPGVGLGAHPDAHVDGFSTGLWSHGASLKGADAQLAVSWTTGEVQGLQGSLAANVSGDLRGLQGSVGVNVADGDVDGAQASTGVNVARGRLRGFQGTAGLNVALGADSEGVQASSGLNVARDLAGVQAAPVNVADHLDGVQAGLVNVGRDVDGLQLGLVNIAKTSDVSIGLLNFIGDGLHRVDIWTSESAVASAAVKFGSKNVYTLLGVGWLNASQSWWTYGAGLGVHLPAGPLWIEVDDSVWSLATGNVLVPGVSLGAVGKFVVESHGSCALGVRRVARKSTAICCNSISSSCESTPSASITAFTMESTRISFKNGSRRHHLMRCFLYDRRCRGL